MLEKKRRVRIRRLSAHRILWICSGLSTVETFFCPQQTWDASFGAVGQHQGSHIEGKQADQVVSVGDVRVFFSCQTCRQMKACNVTRERDRMRAVFSGVQTCSPLFSPRRVLFLFFCQTAWCSIRAGSSFGQERARTAVHRKSRVVYLIKRGIYKTGSDSKRRCLLWIRTIFFTGSRVYARADVLNKPCIAFARKVHRFCASSASAVSAHSFLWICMGLSTAWLPERWCCSACWRRQADVWPPGPNGFRLREP